MTTHAQDRGETTRAPQSSLSVVDRGALLAALRSTLREECEVGISDRHVVHIRLRDADWSLRMRFRAYFDQCVVRWQVVVRDATPELATWWTSGTFHLTEIDSTTMQLATMVADETLRFRTLVQGRSR
jgi:hypothetical protein